jgi:hypothetical protein
MTIEHWWKDYDRAKLQSTKRNTCCKIPHALAPRLNPGLCGKKPVTDCLSHGTAFVVVAVVIIIATTTAAALGKYSYTKIFYLQ